MSWTYTHFRESSAAAAATTTTTTTQQQEQHPPGAGHRVVVEGLSSQSVRPLRGLTGEARSRPGVTVAGGPTVQSDTGQNYYIVLGAELPYLSNAASRRVPSRWAVDAESGTLVARAKVGCGSVKKGQVGGAVPGSRRLWWGGAGAGSVVGRGGRRRGSPLGCVRPCDHAATISSNSVPQIQFIDSGWIFLFRDGHSQCKLCSRSSRFLWCRSWIGS